MALVLGVLVQGNEYGWQTVKTAQTQLPGRLAITLGRLIALAVLILLTVLALCAVDSLAAYLIALADGKSTAPPSAIDIFKGIGAERLILEFMAVLGFGLATLFRQFAIARIHDWFPIASAAHLQQSFGQVSSVVGVTIVSAGEVNTTGAVLVLAVWVAGLAMISSALVRLRDTT